MGLISFIKSKLGIGGVKVALTIPAQIPKDQGSVEGKFVLTSKSDQHIVGIEVKFLEEWTTGRGDDKDTTELTLGEIKIPGGFDIKAGENKEISFTLPYVLAKSKNDEMKEKGGVVGALGKMGSFMDGEKSKYFVEVDVDVKTAALDPSDKKPIKLV